MVRVARTIRPIRIPSPNIRDLPPPVTQEVPRPEIEIPVLEIPNPVIEYPVIDAPTREEFEGQLGPPAKPVEEAPIDTRNLPAATIDVPGVGPVDLPPVAPLITAGATAAVTATVTMGSVILLNALKDKFLGPLVERVKRKKKKLKQKKPVLHFIREENGVRVMEYTVKGIRLVDTTENIEQYLRDQVDIDSLYEYDNKLLIDSGAKDMMTKEGQKRFKKYFVKPQAMVKKLSARLSL